MEANNKVTAIMMDESLRLTRLANKLGFIHFIEVEAKHFKDLPEERRSGIFAHFKEFNSFAQALDFYKTLKEQDSRINIDMNFEGIVYVELESVRAYIYSGYKRDKIRAIYNIDNFLPI